MSEATMFIEKEHTALTLPEDDPTAMNILLAMMHSAREHPPAASTLDDTLEITILMDKYDCHEAIRNIVHGWMNRWATGQDEELYMQLSIASVL